MNAQQIGNNDNDQQYQYEEPYIVDDKSEISASKKGTSNYDNNNNNNNDNNNDDDDDDDGSNTSLSPYTSTFNLDKMVQQFGHNVELLQLVLSSKVEEDRRRTEEARLKSKQLDYLLQLEVEERENDSVSSSSTVARSPRHDDHRLSLSMTHHSGNDIITQERPFSHRQPQSCHYTLSLEEKPNLISLDDPQHLYKKVKSDESAITTPLPPISALDPSNKPLSFFLSPTQSTAAPSTARPTITFLDNHPDKRRSIVPRSTSLQIDDTTISFPSSPRLPPPHTPPTLPPMSSPILTSTGVTAANRKIRISKITPRHHYQQHSHRSSSKEGTVIAPSSSTATVTTGLTLSPGAGSLPAGSLPAGSFPAIRPIKRRRREMQTITMIIETKEFPYNDNYSWKNNGNTVHKNTGQRSIYYKCNNSTKGCHVNKTVTFKGQGEYLIKYRGHHLKDCGLSNRQDESSSKNSIQ